MLDEVTAALAAIKAEGGFAVELALSAEALHIVVHEYTQKSLGWDHLKNADRLRAAALGEVAGRLDCEVYLALADVNELWSCEEEEEWCGYDWRRRGDDNASCELTDLLEDDIELWHWIGPDGRIAPGLLAAPSDQEICFTRPSVELDPFRSRYEGYMGNYGNTMERWYHRAAIVLWPRARNFVVRASMSPSWAVGEIAALVKAGAVDEARGRARELLPFWPGTGPFESSATFVPRLLAALAVLDDADLAFELLAPLGPHRLGARAIPAFAALVERHGLAWAKRLFSTWTDESRNQSWLASLPRLCEALTAGGEHGRALALWLVSREVAAFKQRRVDKRGVPSAHAEEAAGGHLGDIEALLLAAAVVPAPAIRDELVAVLVAPDTGLPLATAGALLHKVRDKRKPAEVRALGLHALYCHVVEAAATAVATPERRPDDWTIEPPTRCDCALCHQLASFLRDSDRPRYAWPLAQEQRRHVHEVIDANGLPVTHTTIRKGRPYTLVLTKQAALFEREAADRSRRKTLLTWLKGQQRAFAGAPGRDAGASALSDGG